MNYVGGQVGLGGRGWSVGVSWQTLTLMLHCSLIIDKTRLGKHKPGSAANLNERRHEKTNILVFDLVGHKPGCTATEDG